MSNDLKRILPAFDMLLLLVIILFGTAGLMGLNQGPIQKTPSPSEEAKEKLEKLLAQEKQLKDELKTKEDEALALANKLHDVNEHDLSTQSLDDLKSKLALTEQMQQGFNETESKKTEVDNKLDYVGKTFQKRYEQQQLLALFKSKTKDLDNKIEELERKRKELEEKITEADLRRVEVQKLKGQIEKLEEQIKHLQGQIEELEEKIEKIKSHDSLWWGQHRGQYVLLECDGKGVVVYLHNGVSRRIAINASEADIDWLTGKIKQMGGALFAVRPSGFNESYSKFFKILTTFAIKEKENNNEIDLSFWPIKDDELISKYMSRGD